MKRINKITSILLALIMLVSLMPTGILAAKASQAEITYANITIINPVGGETPDFSPVSSEPDKYYAEVESWGWMYAGSVTPMGPDSEYKTLERYVLRVIFRTKAGCSFADDCVFTINGKTTGCYSLNVNACRQSYIYAADPLCPTYKVSFDANGGSGSMAEDTGVFDSYELPWCGFDAPSGEYFEGWLVGGYVKDPGEEISVLKDTVLKACWRDIPTNGYKISFDANNGGGSMTEITDFYGAYTLPECGFTPPAGKKFDKWLISGTSRIEPSGEKINVTNDCTLIAIWKDAPVEDRIVTVEMKSGDFIYDYDTAWSTALDILVHKELLVPDENVRGFRSAGGKLLFTIDADVRITLADGVSEQDVVSYKLTEEERAAILKEVGVDISEARLTFLAESTGNEFTVVYAVGDGQGGGDLDYVREGSQLVLEQPNEVGVFPIDGMKFSHWLVYEGSVQESNPEVKNPGDVITVTADTYIIAIWSAIDGMKGDFDKDGKITVADSLAALRIAARLAEETAEALEIGDIDADGKITVSDALAILRVAAKMADTL